MPADRLIHPRCGHSEKVTSLTDLEHRVWMQYLLSADDFGVMRCSAVTLQADNDSLATKPIKVIDRCLTRLVGCGLLRSFEHQRRIYLFQCDWQTWQKVEYPRATIQPAPPPESIAICDEATQKLFDIHPGGTGKKFRKRSENIPEIPPEEIPKDAGISAATRETANGLRLTASGSVEGGSGETPPFDRWFQEFAGRYPDAGRTAGPLPEQAYMAVFDRHVGQAPEQTRQMLLDAVARFEVGERWRRGFVKNMTAWLKEGLYIQAPDAKVGPVEVEKPDARGHMPPCRTNTECNERLAAEIAARKMATA